MGYAGLICFSGATAVMLQRMVIGWYDLRLDNVGFRTGRRNYAWGEVSGFTAGNAKMKDYVYFTAGEKPRGLLNTYNLKTPDLVEFLNAQWMSNHSGTAPTLPRAREPWWRSQAMVLGVIVMIFVLNLIQNRDAIIGILAHYPLLASYLPAH
jgi:hypothetical protein